MCTGAEVAMITLAGLSTAGGLYQAKKAGDMKPPNIKPPATPQPQAPKPRKPSASGYESTLLTGPLGVAKENVGHTLLGQ